MTPERWQLVKETLASAMERRTTVDRARFLNEACADNTTLRREVESLLNQSADLLDSWADSGGFIGHDPSHVENAERRVGAYRLVRELGRGGMGAVWLATRADEEFSKTVAIKFLKRGTDTDEVLRRFRAEREILARLEHPNIARLLDGGTTDEGLPYFVMEYVEGRRLTDFVSEEQLSLGERLRLFVKICAAVQFAHQHLIVHRDLKPENILVTADREPKLLDFGIAKLLAPGEGAWEATMVGRERLTPAYASPEQVMGEPITTVSDVYALGALLYEVLCERRPHSFSGERPSPIELVRVICESDPEPPSAAADSPAMRRALRGDLETIILRAMSHDPARRYSGAGDLADDLQRYEEGRPVRAHRDTFGYRLGKFVRRNKLGFTAGVIIVLLIIAGSLATAWQGHNAMRERIRADKRFDEVRKLAHAVLFDYHDQIAALPGSTQVRERLVKDALDYLNRLSRDASADKSVLREIGTAYEKVGQIQGNEYYDNLGDINGAMQSYQKSLSIRRQLHAANPADPEITFELAKSFEGVGDMLNTKEKLPEGLASYRAALPLLRAALALAPNNLTYQLASADLLAKIGDIQGLEGYANLGDTAGALVSYDRAEALLNRLFVAHPGNRDIKSKLADALCHLGALADSAGDVNRALRAGRRSVQFLQELVAADPNNHQYRLLLLSSKAFLRYTLVDSNQLPEAIANSRATIEELKGMIESDRRNVQLRRSLAVTFNALGHDLLLSGNAKAALENHREALSILEEMRSSDSSSEEFKSDVAFTEARLGDAEAASGNFAAALEDYGKAMTLRGGEQVTGSSNARERQNLSLLEMNMGKALSAAGKISDAPQHFSQAISLMEHLVASAPTNAKWRAALALRYSEFGAYYLQSASSNGASADAVRNREMARYYFRRSLEAWKYLQNNGTLFPIDQHKPDEVARAVEKCEPR